MTQSSLPYPLSSIVDDIRRSYDHALYYPALVVALTLPEICIALTFDKENFVKGKHYTAFIDKYTTPSGLGLNGTQCYSLRGGVVHRANASGHPHFPADYVVFTVPESGISIHALTMQGQSGKMGAFFSLKDFIEAMISAAIKWYEENKNNQNVIANLPLLISWREFDTPPFGSMGPFIGSGS